MGRKAKSTTVEISEGIYLKQKDADSAWRYYFRLHNKAFRKSTKTRDRARATHIALEHYHDVKDKRKNQMHLERVSFRKLTKNYLELIQSENKYTYHSETIKRHFLPFFKKFDDVSKITNKDILDYIVARQKKADGKVANQTINRENSVLRQLLQYGIECAFVSKDVRVKPLKNAKSRRRSHFTLQEYETLLKVSRARANEYNMSERNIKAKKISAKELARLTQQHWSRNLLHDIIIILANTGLRVGELATVTWKDINYETQEIQLRHAGKVKSSRRVLMRGYAPNALKRIHKRRQDYAQRNNLTVPENEKVQSLPNGVFVKSLKKGFRELIKACGFKYETTAERHALTSLRHTFATLRLTDTNGVRATTRALAKQMGTSEKMIEQHYGHDDATDYRYEIIGQARKITKT